MLSFFTTYFHRFKRIRFSSMLFVSFLLLCTIPIVILASIFYFQARNNIQESSHSYSNLFASQLNNTINMYMTAIDHTSTTLFTDYDIIYYIGDEDSYSTFDKISTNMKVNLRLSQYSTQMPYLEGIMIISSSGKIYSQGFVPESLSEEHFFNQPWYQDILASRGQLVVSPAHMQKYSPTGPQSLFFMGRALTDPNGRHAGVILFLLSPSSLVSSDEYLSNDNEMYKSRIILLTEDDQLIYDSLDRGLIDKHLRDIPFHEEDYFIHSNESHTTGLKVIVAASKSALYESIRIYRNLALVTLGIMFIAIMISSILLSYQIMKPMNRLIRSMKHVDDGYYQTIPASETNIEFEKLTQTYNLMIAKIKHLFEDVYKAEIKQNEAKFLALQNQINPHWLYNTLESIRMKAQLSGAPEVAVMIKTLGRLFHMALSKKTRPNTIADEIAYVTNYLELQNIRYENRFHLEVNLPGEVLDIPIIRLTFQPIVENSIIHGFLDHDAQYHIYISSQLEGDKLTIRIADDGEGMTEERLEKIRDILAKADVEEQHDNSIGLLNIQERLLLNYGPDCGLRIDSIPNQGTEVQIKIALKGTMLEEESDV